MRKRIISAILALLALLAAILLTACKDGNGVEGKNDMYLILVNKKNAAGENYVPKNLVKLDKEYTNGGKNVELEQKAAEAVLSMIDAMKADGITNVTVTSGYRTYKYQQDLFDRYCNKEKEAHPTWSDTEVKDYVLTYSAYPGTSEHQTGLCVDLITDEMEGLWNYGSETPNNPYDKGFAETRAYTWLLENAHKFGFILRYPEDKTKITGYSYESWHYRFVGVSVATEIYEKGITLEEYLSK